MPIRNVVLTDTQSDLIDCLIASGRYQNESEALRAGLRILDREDIDASVLRGEKHPVLRARLSVPERENIGARCRGYDQDKACAADGWQRGGT